MSFLYIQTIAFTPQDTKDQLRKKGRSLRLILNTEGLIGLRALPTLKPSGGWKRSKCTFFEKTVGDDHYWA